MDTKQLSDALNELALDLRWSWNHAADDLWAQLDPDRWALTRNAWVVLQTMSRDRLQAVAGDPKFETRLNKLIEEKRALGGNQLWFQKAHPNSPLKAVAYFSMEFMLSDALPIYSGGLGNVAGDQLKSASDLGVPVVAVGLLYQRGYFRQHIDAQGRQQALYPFNDTSQLPITPVREANGEWLWIKLDLPGYPLRVRAWQAQVGGAKLYLLDTNDPVNLPEHRGITGELYGGGSETRLQQELVLGIAGWRLLRKLGIDPQVCHLNEGHAAFAVLERARTWVEEQKRPFAEGLSVTRAGNLFTTHTPVEAGFDRFTPELMELHMKGYAEHSLGISFGDLMALGRMNPGDLNEPFNMAWLAVHGSGAVNAVSELHGRVSRHIFQGLFPRWPTREVPIGYVTNGVHVPTWDSAAADDVWTAACGKSRWRGDLKEVDEGIRRVDELTLWKMRSNARKGLVDYVRQRIARQTAGHGASDEETRAVENIFDPETLTLGFARRFATYKRPNLLLHDRDRLLRILTNRQRPVQLIIAGKAHPQDAAGQDMIRQWVEFIRQTAARSNAVFLSDYDMRMTEHLVQGVDLWLNTPRRPWEACGTSGMKVLVNGGLNLSELDGWWAEAWTSETGWALGDGHEHGEDPAWDAAEANKLYDLLENDIIPQFYNRNEHGIPAAWVGKMLESMATLTSQFSANRAVRQYTEDFYLPAADRVLARLENKGKLGIEILQWRQKIANHWPRLRFGELKVDSDATRHQFHVQVYLDELDAAAVRVELVADGNEPVRQEMTRGDVLPGSRNAYNFTAEIPGTRPASDFTPRIVPWHPNASEPLEANEIQWYR